MHPALWEEPAIHPAELGRGHPGDAKSTLRLAEATRLTVASLLCMFVCLFVLFSTLCVYFLVSNGDFYLFSTPTSMLKRPA